ncbi:Cuticle protein 21.3, partial [Gryllus bimaculatus]
VFVLLALLGAARAGGPAAYSTYSASGDFASVGSSQETTLKGLGGQSGLSQYSKAVDSAHSSVRISSSRATNDFGYGAYGGLPAAGGLYGPLWPRRSPPSALRRRPRLSPTDASLAYGARLRAPAIAAAPAIGYARTAIAAPAIAAAPAAIGYGAHIPLHNYVFITHF